MTADKDDEQTQQLVASTGRARARVEHDIEQLALELTPAHVKARALNVAARSLKNLATRGVLRIFQAPRWLARYARQHPLTAVAVVGTTGVLVFRLARRNGR